MRYVGKGRFIVGIPAEDLTDEDIAKLAAKRGVKPADLRKQLEESGLYAGKGKEADAK